MKWLEKYKLKQQKKYEKIINEQMYYQIPKKFLNNPIFKDYNKELINNFSKEVGKELEELYDEESIICIHRTQLDMNTYENQITDIFQNGLINLGGPNHEFTMSAFSEFPVVIMQILNSCYYKQGTCKGAIIIKIPKKRYRF